MMKQILSSTFLVLMGTCDVSLFSLLLTPLKLTPLTPVENPDCANFSLNKYWHKRNQESGSFYNNQYF